MVVKIEEILEKGLRLNEQVGLDLQAEALEGSGFQATHPFALQAFLRKVSRGVLLEASFTSEVSAPCKRCLQETRRVLPVSFLLNLIPESLLRPPQEDEEDEAQDKGTAESAGSFALEEADEEVFDGRTIDLQPIVREQLLLALPMNVLCREDCRGLCSQCGQNLNEKQCGCDTRFVDPRLAVLKDFKLN